MSMAVRNVLGQGACFLDKQIVPGKPLNTKAQRLAIRRSVYCWAASSNYDSSATETLSETRSLAQSSSQSVLDSWAAPQEPENALTKLWQDSSEGQQKTLDFVKYEGLGNNFIMLPAMDLRKCGSENGDVPALILEVNNLDSPEPIITPHQAVRLCDRYLGVGADGVIFVMRHKKDYQMRIYNSDGSEPEMCGNGIRCMAKYLAEIEKTRAPKSYKVLTLGGYMTLDLRKDGQVCVDMGPPNLNAPDVPTKLVPEGEVVKAPLEVDGKTWSVTCVSMGNPHCVTFGEQGGEGLNVDSLPLEKIGPLFEHHEMFPARTNTEFVEVLSPTHLKMRVWERGAGATQACGTGACAIVVAAVKEGRSERSCVVDLPGGPLEIEWREEDNRIYMTGPARRVFHGCAVLED